MDKEGLDDGREGPFVPARGGRKVGELFLLQIFRTEGIKREA